MARALEGDMAALREIGDRLDGKATSGYEQDAGEGRHLVISLLGPNEETLRSRLDAALEGRAEAVTR